MAILQSAKKVSLKAPKRGAWLFVDVESFASYVYDILHKDPLKVPSQHEIDRAVKFLRHLFESFGYKFAAQSNGRRVTTGDVLFQLPWKNGRAEYEDRQNLFASLRKADKKLVGQYRNDPKPKQWRYIPVLRSIRNSIQRNLPCPSINVYDDDAITTMRAYYNFHTGDDLPRFVLSNEVDMLYRGKMRLIYLDSLDKAAIRDLLCLFDDKDTGDSQLFLKTMAGTEQYKTLEIINESSIDSSKEAKATTPDKSEHVPKEHSLLCGLRHNQHPPPMDNDILFGTCLLFENAIRECKFCLGTNKDLAEIAYLHEDARDGTLSPGTLHCTIERRHATCGVIDRRNKLLLIESMENYRSVPGIQKATIPSHSVDYVVSMPPAVKMMDNPNSMAILRLLGLVPPGLNVDTSYLLVAIKEMSFADVSIVHAFMKNRLNVLNSWLMEPLIGTDAQIADSFDAKRKSKLVIDEKKSYPRDMQSVHNVLEDTLTMSGCLTLETSTGNLARVLQTGRFKDLREDMHKLAQLSVATTQVFSTRFFFLQALPPIIRRKLVMEMLWESSWEVTPFAQHFFGFVSRTNTTYIFPSVFSNAHSFKDVAEFRCLKYALFATCFMQLQDRFPNRFIDNMIPKPHILCFIITLLISNNENHANLERNLPKMGKMHPLDFLYIRTAFENLAGFLEGHETIWNGIENPFIPQSPADVESLDTLGFMFGVEDSVMAKLPGKNNYTKYVPRTFSAQGLKYRNYGIELPTTDSYYTSWKTYRPLMLDTIKASWPMGSSIHKILEKYFAPPPRHFKVNSEDLRKENPAFEVPKCEMFTFDSRNANYFVFFHLLLTQLRYESDSYILNDGYPRGRKQNLELAPQIVDFLSKYPDLNAQFMEIFDVINSAEVRCERWEIEVSTSRLYSPIGCIPTDESLLVPSLGNRTQDKDDYIPVDQDDASLEDEVDSSFDEGDGATAGDSSENYVAQCVYKSFERVNKLAQTQTTWLAVNGANMRGRLSLHVERIRYKVKASDNRLPIRQARELLMQAIVKNTVTFVSANTGTGKSSLLPIYLYEQGNKSAIVGESKIMPIPWQSNLPANIYCAVPTRVAAQSLAKYVAAKTHTKLGDLVGYRLEHGECCASANTRITYCTIGWLVTALFQSAELTQEAPESLRNNSDFSLFGVPVTHILIDDSHLRTIQVGLLLLLMKLLITRYLKIRFHKITDMLTNEDRIAASLKYLMAAVETVGLGDTPVQFGIDKDLEAIHDMYANRTRWVIMSATAEVFDIMSYVKQALNDYYKEMQTFLLEKKIAFLEESFGTVRESLTKLSISRFLKTSFDGDIATVRESLLFDPAVSKVLLLDKPIHINVTGVAFRKYVHYLDNLRKVREISGRNDLLSSIKLYENSIRNAKTNEARFPIPDSINSKIYVQKMKTVVQFCLQVVVNADANAALVFVSGREDIETLMEEFKLLDRNLKPCQELDDEFKEIPALISENYVLIPLHGAFERADLQRAIGQDFPGRKKLYLATNVVENSITIGDLDIVIDLGLHYLTQYDSLQQRDIVKRTWISKSSAIQRAGRVGRTRPGTVYRFYPKSLYDRFFESSQPEITHCSADDLVLFVQSLKSRNLTLNLLDLNREELSVDKHILVHLIWKPDMAYLVDALRQLFYHGILSAPNLDATPTVLGDSLLICPFDSTSSRILYIGHVLNCLPEAVIIAATLASKDIFLLANATMERETFLCSVRENAIGRIRAGTIVGPKGQSNLQFLHSDILSILNVYTQIMQVGGEARGKLYMYYKIHHKRFEKLRAQIRYFAGVAMHFFKDSDYLSPLIDQTAASDIKSLLHFDIDKYRAILFLLFYKDLVFIKNDARKLKFTLRKKSLLDAKVLELVKAQLHVELDVEETYGIPTIACKSCTDSVQNILENSSVKHSVAWRETSNELPTYITYPLEDTNYIADVYLYALSRSNDKFFTNKMENTNVPSNENAHIDANAKYSTEDMRYQMQEHPRWLGLMKKKEKNPSDSDPPSPGNNKNPEEMLRSHLDAIFSSSLKCSTAFSSPCAFVPFSSKRLFGVGANTFDSGGSPNERRRADLFNVITGCEATLALYFFCFVTPLKMKFVGSFGSRTFYSNDSSDLAKEDANSNSHEHLVNTLVITTEYYELQLRPLGLKLTDFQELLQCRESFIALIRDGPTANPECPFDTAIERIQDILNAAV